MDASVSKKELRRRLRWFIQIRWLAVMGVFVTLGIAKGVLNLPIPTLPFLIANLLLMASNIIYSLINRRIEHCANDDIWYQVGNRLANVQIITDLLFLTVFLHFSGGAENPFIFFFLFHMVIASILLSKRAAYAHAVLANIFLGSLILLESQGGLPHHHLTGFIPEDFCLLHSKFISGLFFVFSTTSFIMVYLATSIVDRLREEERQLAHSNHLLEEQDRLKSQYLLRVSHDLKASLSVIQICCKVVLDNLAGPISDKSRDLIGRAEQRAMHLISFVKSLLDLSRIRAAQKTEKDEISLSEIVGHVAEIMRHKAETKNQTLHVESKGPFQIWANPSAIEEALTNIVSNAIKYTKEKGTILIEEKNANQSDYVEVSVTDNGMGVPKDALSHLFDDFFRADNAHEIEQDGTGLGLSIVKKIIDNHEGQIWVESELNKGSKFCFTLPKGRI